MKKYCVIIVFIVFLSQQLRSQDIHFSQFYIAPSIINPAFTAMVSPQQASAGYRNQWRSVSNPFITYFAAYDLALNKHRGQKGYWATGISVIQDKAGDFQLKTFQANINLAYHIQLNEHSTLGTGLQGNYIQRSINSQPLKWGNQFDGLNYNSSLSTGEIPLANSSIFFDGGLGLAYHYFKGRHHQYANKEMSIEAGTSISHFIRPRYSFYSSSEQLYAKYTVYSKLLIKPEESSLGFVPSVIYMRQGPAQNFMIGSLFSYIAEEASQRTGYVKSTVISFGGYYRFKDALVVSSLLEHSNIALGVNYDINISRLTASSKTKGGFEISFRYINKNSLTKRKN